MKDPSGFISNVIMSSASKVGPGIGCGGSNGNYDTGLVSTGIIYSSSTMLYGPGVDTQQVFRDAIIHGFTATETYNQALLNQRIDAMIEFAKLQAKEKNASGWWERNYEDVKDLLKATSSKIGRWVDNDVYYNDWYYDTEITGIKVTEKEGSWCSVFVTYNMITAGLSDAEANVKIFPTKEEAKANNFKASAGIMQWYESQGRYHTIEEVIAGTYTPKKGDIFFKEGDREFHSGLVTEYNTNSKKISTVDGNTTKTIGSNIGYGVFEHEKKDINNYIGFGDNYYSKVGGT